MTRQPRRLFREFEHTGDAGIEVDAPSRAELFARAALAMARLMVEETGVEPVARRELEAHDGDDAEKLHDLLAAALNLFLLDGFIWRDATAREDGDRVVLTLAGERYDRKRHVLLGEIKAVTYHELSVMRMPAGGWRARIIFDI